MTTIKPQAYLVLTNNYFLEISIDDKFSDLLYYRYWGTKEEERTEAEIEYDATNGVAYFTTVNGTEYTLSDFMKY